MAYSTLRPASNTSALNLVLAMRLEHGLSVGFFLPWATAGAKIKSLADELMYTMTRKHAPAGNMMGHTRKRW